LAEVARAASVVEVDVSAAMLVSSALPVALMRADPRKRPDTNHQLSNRCLTPADTFGHPLC
jgi:hypothetical protein